MSYVLSFDKINRHSLPAVGGKGANLGELTKAGFPVPPGFCVTTEGYRRFIRQSETLATLLNDLEQVQTKSNILDAGGLQHLRRCGKQIREHLCSLSIPEDVQTDIIQAWQLCGTKHSYAVRSSATAEDLPDASFAGQQDTFLNVRGEEQLLSATKRCWVSLFTDRAIAYRIKNGYDHRTVLLSVVVQKMIFPSASGIMFTADPVTGRRPTVSIDASFGLGEAVVSGIVSADLYQVQEGKIVKKQVEEKKKVIHTLSEGGTVTQDIEEARQKKQALPDEQIIALAKLGKRIEAHYGTEQDIEWCLADGEIYIVQSRPITSLYPLPDAKDDRLRIFLSFGHRQMMTDAFSPMGISFFRTLAPFGKQGDFRSESPMIVEAGSRMFLDMTEMLYMKSFRTKIESAMAQEDERWANAIAEAISRERFQREARPNREVRKIKRGILKIAPKAAWIILKNICTGDPVRKAERANACLKRRVQQNIECLSQTSGVGRIRYMQESLGTLAIPMVFKQLLPCIMTGMVCWQLIENLAHKWLVKSEEEVRSLLAKLNLSLPGNVTSELGLVLGDVADTARQYPQVIAYLQQAQDDTFYEGLARVKGGKEFRQVFDAFMDRYGMRAPGEIDVARTRWRESPTTLVSSIISHIRSVEPGEHRRKFEQGEEAARQAADRLLAKVRQTRGGYVKAKIMSRLIRVFRPFMGVREYPKYMMVTLFDACKKALLEEAECLTEKGILAQKEDIFYLTLAEVADVLDNRFEDEVRDIIRSRKVKKKHDEKRTPPRILTSEGEALDGHYNTREAPDGAFLGTAVSSGVVEGKARVVLNPEEAELHAGEIMVAPFTDPGWTPLFQSARGLVMEIGGMMTHGSVVAREYGIPAVVGIEDATVKIQNGQWLRVNGTEGYVQIITDPADDRADPTEQTELDPTDNHADHVKHTEEGDS